MGWCGYYRQTLNATLLAAAVADSTASYLGETFGSGTTGAEAWDKLVDLTTAFQTARLTEDNAYIAPAVWGVSSKGVETLRVGINPEGTGCCSSGCYPCRCYFPIHRAARHCCAFFGGACWCARRIASIKQHRAPIDGGSLAVSKCGAEGA